MNKSSLGLRYMVESAFYFSVMSVLVKLAGQTVPFQEIVMARTVVAFVLSLVMLKHMGVSPWGVHKPLLAARGLVGFIALCCFYYSVTHIPLADATVIQYTNPVFVAVLAAAFLAEPVAGVAVLGSFVSLVGVVIVAQPPILFGGVESLSLFDVGVALTGAVISAFAYTIVRKLGETEEPLVVVFWFPLMSLPFIVPWAISTGYVPDWWELMVLLAVGISTQAAQIRLTQGLRLESAGRAMSMTYLQIVFAVVWGMLLFGEVPTWATAVGATIVVGSVVAVARRRQHG